MHSSYRLQVVLQPLVQNNLQESSYALPFPKISNTKHEFVLMYALEITLSTHQRRIQECSSLAAPSVGNTHKVIPGHGYWPGDGLYGGGGGEAAPRYLQAVSVAATSYMQV